MMRHPNTRPHDALERRTMNRTPRILLALPALLLLCSAGWIDVQAREREPQRPSAGQSQPQPAQPQPRPGQEPERVAQPTPPPATPVNPSDDPLLRAFRFRSIGPASMGGRIDDIAAVERDPSVMYVGFATGGVYKTANNGVTWSPIFDTYPVSSIGAVTVDQKNPNIVWVGTGEANNRQSSSFGDGIYKSTDAGKTFVHAGLKETQSIARIVVDPRNSDIVYVAAVGHLFGPNPERGLYKTVDGGRTWTLGKAVDADTGFTDVAIDPSDSKTLYAASYQRRRVPWGFNGGGPGSALWKTTDAGKTWTKLEGHGLPSGLLGRIGLAVSASNPKVVYAQIEVGASAGTGGNVTAAGKPFEPSAGRGGAPAAAPAAGGQAAAAAPADPKRSGVWRSDDKGRTWRIVSNNNDRPMYYSQIRVDPTNPEVAYTMGAPFHKSVDGGRTFKVVAGIAHSDHHAMWIDPRDPKHLVLGNDGGLDVSYDQGSTWEFVNTLPVGQFYAISADMQKPYWVCGGLQDNGSWCGPSAVRSTLGILNSQWFRIGGGDGFYTQQDPTDPNIIYVESQDGNAQRLDLRTGRTVSIRPRAAGRPRPQAGAESQPGETPAPVAPAGPGQAANIVPPPPPGEQYRFFWNTPIALSPHNPRTIYVGANQLFRSPDRGDTYLGSPDLTQNISRFERPIMGVPGDAPMASKHDGAGAFSSIVTISESPVQPGVIWVGTNDGNVQVTRDGGATWTNVVDRVPGAPKEAHVSRVEASRAAAGTCYVSFDNHRVDDMKPYVFVTRDFGVTWTSVVGNLPAWGNVNVIREDPRNPRLLFAGTEFGLFVSLNGGAEWKRFMNGLPVVRVDDLLVHPRENDLIVATHGRSLYIMDDITPLQQLTDTVTASDVHLFDVRPGVPWLTDVRLTQSVGGAKYFRGENPQQGTAVSYYLKTAPEGDVKVSISDASGRVLRTLDGTKQAGINRVVWNLRGTLAARPAAGAGGAGGPAGFMVPPVSPGTYLVKLSVGGKDYTTAVVVEEDDFGKK
jgi:photosystem II stability/assembly factor-like uncharacterized protein